MGIAKKKNLAGLTLTVTFERVESNCILRLWRQIMRQSQTGPLESSFCLVVLTRGKKNHSRPAIYAVTITGPNIQLRFLYFGFLMGGREHSKEILSIYGIPINFLVPGYQKTAQPWLQLFYFWGFMQTQGHTGMNQAAKCKQSTPWGNSSLLPK